MGIFNKKELDPSLKCDETNKIHHSLQSKVIGQEEALNLTSNVIQTYKAGFNNKSKPLAVSLFLGPTGTGKTRTIEALAETLFGSEKAFFKIDCGEFQNSSSVSTLLGAAPGYIGHKSGEPFISQAKLDKYKTKDYPINILLLDEIEKAHESVLQLFLGVLDKATLKTNTGEVIDFSHTIIFMTSNLGAEGITNADKIALGFDGRMDKKKTIQIHKAATVAAEKFFKPEFMNRIDHTVVFNSLTYESIQQILALELQFVRKTIFTSNSHIKFTFICTPAVDEFLLSKGYSEKFGARKLKREIGKLVTDKLASLMMSGQIGFGDLIILSLRGDTIVYEKLDSDVIYNYSYKDWNEFKKQIIDSELEQEAEKSHDVLVAGASNSLQN